jgi:hypothetical protein
MPIQGDESRQAVPALRGYRYKILRTVYEWLDLKEGTCLYLEGAEGFDIVSSTTAEATHVKHSDTPASLTLRSPAAIAAIDSYWTLQAVRELRNGSHGC